MAKTFAVTTTAIEPQRADAKGHAQAIFTVTNTTSRPVRGLAKPKPLGDTKREWLTLEGEAERDFAAVATHQFTVNFDGPISETAGATPSAAAASGATAQPSGAPESPRKYSFRLDVASAQNPDEDFTEGPVVTVELAAAAAAVERKKFPLWIIFVLAGVLLLIGGIVLVVVLTRGDGPTPTPSPEPEVSPSPTVSPRPPVGKFEGRWTNVDPNTGGITRMEIAQTGSQLRVRAFGKCHPTDCDWGTERGAVVADRGQVTWDQGFALVKMIITVEGENRLKVVTDTVFNDARPRQHAEYLFNKRP